MLSYELSETLRRYVQGHISVEELEDWLVPRLTGLLTFAASSDSRAAAITELGLAEMNDGLRSEEDFRASLAKLLRDEPTVLVFFDPSQHSQTGSANTTTRTASAVAKEPATIVLEW